MSGGKPVFVSVIDSPKARSRWRLVPRLAPHQKEETFVSQRFRILARAGQVSMAYWKVSGSVLHRGQVRSRSSSNQEGSAAR